jgi:uncharacterized protein
VKPRLILFTRFPTPGMAKTRLIPILGPRGAAHAHKMLTERTVKILLLSKAPVEVHFTGATDNEFADWLGEDMSFVPQADGDLGARLLSALDPEPCIFFGADTPDLSPAIVAAAIDALEHHDVVIGPAEDGGYYLIGMKNAQQALFHDIEWSTDTVFSETMKRVRALGLDFTILKTLADCDRPEDLARWPWLTQ